MSSVCDQNYRVTALTELESEIFREELSVVLRSDKVTWVFNHTIKSLKLVISIVNFQMAITQLNLGRFAKSQTFLKSSLNALQDSCIGS